MFDWFKSKKTQQDEPPVQQANIEALTKFIAEYNPPTRNPYTQCISGGDSLI